jgi:hypothetical protein
VGLVGMVFLVRRWKGAGGLPTFRLGPPWCFPWCRRRVLRRVGGVVGGFGCEKGWAVRALACRWSPVLSIRAVGPEGWLLLAARAGLA